MDIEFNKEYKRLRAVIRGNCDDNIKNSARLEMAKRWLLTCDMEYTTDVYNSIGIPDTYIRKFDDIINFTHIYESYNTTKSDEYCKNINDVRYKLRLLITLPVIWYCAYNDKKPNIYLRDLYSGINKLLSDDIFNHAVKIIYSFYTVFIGSIAYLSEPVKEYMNLNDHIDSAREFDIFEYKIKTYIKSISNTNVIYEIMQEEISIMSALINIVCDVYSVDNMYSKDLKSKLEAVKTDINILKERSK